MKLVSGRSAKQLSSGKTTDIRDTTLFEAQAIWRSQASQTTRAACGKCLCLVWTSIRRADWHPQCLQGARDPRFLKSGMFLIGNKLSGLRFDVWCSVKHDDQVICRQLHPKLVRHAQKRAEILRRDHIVALPLRNDVCTAGVDVSRD